MTTGPSMPGARISHPCVFVRPQVLVARTEWKSVLPDNSALINLSPAPRGEASHRSARKSTQRAAIDW
jgi:hypothetical protein